MIKELTDKDINKKVVLCCPMQDQQTGLYIRNALVRHKCPTAIWDWREELKLGKDYMNQKFITDIERLKPDFVLICKGLGFTADTIKEIKKHTKVIYWMFDHTLGGFPILDNQEYTNAIREADVYYTVVRGDIDYLKKGGVNAKLLLEAASEHYNYPVELNYYEKEKYGADVIFAGSIGTKGYHEDRLQFLDMILQAGFKLKIYGAIEHPELVPPHIKMCHMNAPAINDLHNIICNAGKIHLGRSGWPEVDLAMSARTYRVMASGGFHLTNSTKGIETLFTPGKHLDVYTNNLDCLRKIKYWLEHPEEREKVAIEGMKEVLDKHTFYHRIGQILDELK